MTKEPVGQPRKYTVSRRGWFGLASGAAVFTFWHRKAPSFPRAEQYVDRAAAERIADRAAPRPPILVDAQTHVWWRAGGVRQMSERGEHFLKSLAGSRAGVVGHPVPIADMGRVMFLEDVFLGSETDIAFLNSFGMRAAFDGVDLFPPREAAYIRSMAPSRIRVLGTVDPPDGASAVESLIYQCETIKIDGLKLYPPGPDTRGWVLDDEKNTYPLFEVLRRHGVKNVCVHKGLPGLFLEQYCHTDDLARAAAAFPDLNFIAFHSAFPWEAELAGQAKAAKVKNIYAELGTLARMMRTDPARYSVLIGYLLDGFGADHILWGTDTPVIGPPHWQIEAFQTFAIPEELAAQHGYSQLTPEVKNKIFGENAARIFGIDIAAARQAIEGDLLYKLRDDRNPLPAVAAPL
ncbi:MAG TPA: amidohydrolase family protein [Stellaceae bacterium]|nr:amidohydrolase family protein [Stellaceae bacterium]